jgi:hypothetical protein
MLARVRPWLNYANVTATIAMFIALGGTGLAASQLGKNTVGTKQLKKNAVTTAKIRNEAVTGAKVRKGSLTGVQVNASTLGLVPNASNAAHATNAENANHADFADRAQSAEAVGEDVLQVVGQGVVSGSTIHMGEGGAGEFFGVPPSGIFNLGAGGGQTDTSVGAIAPVNMTIRDFVGDAAVGWTGTESIHFGLLVTPAGASEPTTVPLCNVSGTAKTCRVDGPITIPRNAVYQIELLTLSEHSGDEAVGYQYRAAAG